MKDVLPHMHRAQCCRWQFVAKIRNIWLWKSSSALKRIIVYIACECIVLLLSPVEPGTYILAI